VRPFPSTSNLPCAAAIFCLILATTLPVLRAEPSKIPLTADSAVALGIKGNKELAAARFLLQEAEGRARGSGRLPNPELEAEVAAGQDFEGHCIPNDETLDATGLKQQVSHDRRIAERESGRRDATIFLLEERAQHEALTLNFANQRVDLRF
jgi:hypothetical protein